LPFFFFRLVALFALAMAALSLLPPPIRSQECPAGVNVPFTSLIALWVAGCLTAAKGALGWLRVARCLTAAKGHLLARARDKGSGIELARHFRSALCGRPQPPRARRLRARPASRARARASPTPTQPFSPIRGGGGGSPRPRPCSAASCARAWARVCACVCVLMHTHTHTCTHTCTHAHTHTCTHTVKKMPGSMHVCWTPA
jgi:hypothetical protein